MSPLIRRACGVAAAALLVSSVGMAPAQADAARSEAASKFVAKQLTGNLVHNDQFDFTDYGLSVDLGLAMLETGDTKTARGIAKALAKHSDDYTAPDGDVFAGSTAKLAIYAQRSGADATKFGGVDLIKQLESRVTTVGPTKGRTSDLSEFGDYANTLGQAYAVEALSTANSKKAKHAVSFLLAQQCKTGAFRLDFAPVDQAQNCDAGTGEDKAPDTDATAIALLALDTLTKPSAKVRTAKTKALTWLAKSQANNGSFGGGISTESANANSTGLAAWAFLEAGECKPAVKASRWLSKLAVDKSVKGGLGAIAYDKASLKALNNDGITVEVRDQLQRATAQAIPAYALAGNMRECQTNQ